MPNDASTSRPLNLRLRRLVVGIVREAVRAELDAPTADRRVPVHLLSLAEVAGVLGVSVRTVQRLVRRGEIGTVRAGALRRVHPDALDAYIRAHSKYSR